MINSKGGVKCLNGKYQSKLQASHIANTLAYYSQKLVRGVDYRHNVVKLDAVRSRL